MVVLLGTALWVLSGGVSDVPSTVLSAAQATTDVIGQVLGRLQAEVFPSGPTQATAPIRQPMASVSRSPRRAAEPGHPAVDATATPLTAPPFVPGANNDPTSAEEETVLPAEVFSAADNDVVPPTLASLHRLSGRLIGTPGGKGAILELVVNEAGRVDGGTILDVPPTLSEYVVAVSGLSAAKAWLFRPATRQGVAVKYRLRIALDRPQS
ncbi:MAG: hypothetical protein ABL971_14105 [Vicinamibacterales bacterium]